MIRYGLGRHIWIAPQGALTVFLQGLFISELCYTGVLVIVKFSILALYWRIFRVRSMQISIYVVATLVTCWGVAVVRECLSNFQEAINAYVSLFFRSSLRLSFSVSRCADSGTRQSRQIAMSMIINFFWAIRSRIYVSTCPYLFWTLKISRFQKISLTIIIILGGL